MRTEYIGTRFDTAGPGVVTVVVTDDDGEEVVRCELDTGDENPDLPSNSPGWVSMRLSQVWHHTVVRGTGEPVEIRLPARSRVDAAVRDGVRPPSKNWPKPRSATGSKRRAAGDNAGVHLRGVGEDVFDKYARNGHKRHYDDEQ